MEAHIAGLLNFDEALEKLPSTNSRLPADVERRNVEISKGNATEKQFSSAREKL